MQRSGRSIIAFPTGMAVESGSVVVAPLGPRQMLGIAWEAERLPSTEVPDSRLRPLGALLDVRADRRAVAAARPNGRRIITCAPLASVLRMVLPSSAALEGPRQLT